MSRKEQVKLIYYRHSEGVESGRYSELENIIDDIVVVGQFRPEEVWELTVGLRDIPPLNDPVLEMQIFGDSFQVFADFKAFFAWLSAETPTTLDEVQRWLDERGVVNGIMDL